MPTDYENLVLRESPDTVVVLSPEGKVLHWTKGAERVFGDAREDALGRRLSDMLVPAEHHEDEHRQLRRAIDEGSCSYESIRRKKDGSLIYVDITAKSISDDSGIPQLILSTQKDVSALKVLRDAKLLDSGRDQPQPAGNRGRHAGDERCARYQRTQESGTEIPCPARVRARCLCDRQPTGRNRAGEFAPDDGPVFLDRTISAANSRTRASQRNTPAARKQEKRWRPY